eukprot:4981599-Pyramimonas_sp.AAC.1
MLTSGPLARARALDGHDPCQIKPRGPFARAGRGRISNPVQNLHHRREDIIIVIGERDQNRRR